MYVSITLFLPQTPLPLTHFVTCFDLSSFCALTYAAPVPSLLLSTPPSPFTITHSPILSMGVLQVGRRGGSGGYSGGGTRVESAP